MSTVTANTEKTSPKLAVGYGMGEVGMQMSWYMINNYLTLFYTDVVGEIQALPDVCAAVSGDLQYFDLYRMAGDRSR